MAAKGEPVYYSPLPPAPQQDQPPPQQHYVILPLYRPPNRHRHRRLGLRHCLVCFITLILLALAVFFLWPSDPELTVVRLQLNNVQIHTTPKVSLDISLAVTLKVHNRDIFSFDYSSLVVSIGYRGRELGFVNSTAGVVSARRTSYVKALLDLNGLEVLHDAFYLLEDLAKGSILFDTVTKVRGNLGILFFEIPLKAKVSCEIYLDTKNQTITRQDCSPE